MKRITVSRDGPQPARRRLCRTGRVLAGHSCSGLLWAIRRRSSAPIGGRWPDENRWSSMRSVGRRWNPTAKWGIFGSNRESSAGEAILRPSGNPRQSRRIVGVPWESLAPGGMAPSEVRKPSVESLVAVANRRRLSGDDVLGESSAAVANRWRLWEVGAAGEVDGADRDSSADWDSSAIVTNRRRPSGGVGTWRDVAVEWGIFGRSL